MANEDEQILVELEPDEGAKPAIKAEAEPVDGVKRLEEQLAAAKAATAAEKERADNERRNREAAQREAAEYAKQVQEARTQTGDAEAEMINTALAAAQSERDSAKAAFKAAFEAGDSEKAAEAQSRISRAEAKILNYEGANAELSTRKPAEKQQETKRAEPPDANQIINSLDIMPEERAWLRAHPEVVTNPALNNELGVAYQRATREKLERGTPEYFAYIEEFMGYAKKAEPKPQEEERTSIVAAPVSRDVRSAATGERVTPQKVKLTPKQVEMAEMMGLSVEDYARGYLQMDQDKRANPEKYALR